ncbi:D-xylose ABC transporter ATP-binding protein [Candidatus Epulonipiscium fishelsonii]|uniref:D-xylose ABC transporter ATP-binding protein n=1 Tax=Candidatus Epulonipiscium fishelsonii TaxID=77094 RepID=A0ACC8XHB5_9FIRM|nr:D-xylose ABC transporter ATP-binding protein [Epulopiscium sp. SCG-B05WGA-EpuloA1]ONI43035.1 D-xylose ABC transporter ATP-binding protein [Epulopiscium sp. SCG-B11WGA-EpuloA1]
MKDITKEYPGVKALKGVQFKLKKGTVHALMGENGAGKSTLMKILCGMETPNSGQIILGGNEVSIPDVRTGIKNGISMIHQELSPVLEMSVAENIFLGREIIKKISRKVDHKSMNQQAQELLKEQVGIELNPALKMKNLSVAQMQMVEIVKAISQDANIIIMDEPTSSITENEVEKLFALIRKLTSQGKSIIYISHKMEEIFQISDEITVFRDGQYIGTDLSSNLDDRALIKMMVGRELNEIYPKEEVPITDILLETSSLSKEGKFKDISFSLRKGEILGFAGLVGAGRTELVEAIFGFKPADSGDILINNKKVNIKSPQDGIKNKIAFISEDRKQVGLNLIASIKDNITLANMKSYCIGGIAINHSCERRLSAEYAKKLNVKMSSIDMAVGKLSGGNQQKVILAKWISCDPDIIILDEPTRGIDVGAKAEIYKIMVELAREGKAIIMITSEMPEAIGMSDRIVVLSNGKMTGVFDRNEFDQEKIMLCASGVNKEEIS